MTSLRKNFRRGGSGWSSLERGASDMSEHSPLEIVLELGEAPGKRLDKALSAVMPEQAAVSRSRLVGLIREGCLTDEDGMAVTDPSARPEAGATYLLRVAVVNETEVRPEALPLDIVYEDGDLLVVDKPAGMVVHPAPGSPNGTLVNGLLHHCGDSLSGIGGVRRPGIVHRIDKDTSGLLVVAKSDAAHHGLSKQFADHSIERRYEAFVWGVPSAGDPRLAGMSSVSFEDGGLICIRASIARHKSDRKKMAVLQSGGRHAVTRIKPVLAFRDFAAQVSCRLETGRTHQIRVHATHIGHPLIGDPLYGRARSVPASLPESTKKAIAGFGRQALHARSLGFVHPVTGKTLRFECPLPADMERLRAALTG